MRKFITTRPEVASGDFGSPYDPVLAGVAQGLSRLFPPVRKAGPARVEDAAAVDPAEVRHETASRGEHE